MGGVAESARGFVPGERLLVLRLPPNERRAARWAALLSFVASEGFEPPKATPADLQSDPFGRLGNSPGCSDHISKIWPEALDNNTGADDAHEIPRAKEIPDARELESGHGM
ncbi:MAG: hypothetical protein JWR33_1406 [Naasia sp.]|nr:hypothetical protein [Naasia sp.]